MGGIRRHVDGSSPRLPRQGRRPSRTRWPTTWATPTDGATGTAASNPASATMDCSTADAAGSPRFRTSANGGGTWPTRSWPSSPKCGRGDSGGRRSETPDQQGSRPGTDRQAVQPRGGSRAARRIGGHVRVRRDMRGVGPRVRHLRAPVHPLRPMGVHRRAVGAGRTARHPRRSPRGPVLVAAGTQGRPEGHRKRGPHQGRRVRAEHGSRRSRVQGHPGTGREDGVPSRQGLRPETHGAGLSARSQHRGRNAHEHQLGGHGDRACRTPFRKVPVLRDPRGLLRPRPMPSRPRTRATSST